jgi:Glycosyltransferase family 87
MTTARAASRRLSAKLRTGPIIGVVETVLLVFLAGLTAWKALLPGWRVLNTDFPNYYVAARLMRSHYCLDRLYDWIWFQRVSAEFGVTHQLAGFLGLTPFSALPLIPFSWLPVLEAKRIWLVCNVALLAATVHFLSRQCGLGYRRTWLIALCAIVPLRTSFLLGQMHVLILFLLSAAFVCHMRSRQIASGSIVAIAAALKIYPVFFCVYFIIKRRWTALAAAVVCLGFCVFLSYLAAGRTAMDAYFFQQLPRSLQGESQDPFLPTLASASSMFHRLFLYEPELNPQPVVASPALYSLVYALWQAMLAALVLSRLRRHFHADSREALEWAAFLCLLMFLSSAPASYQFVALIAAAVPTISVLLQQSRQRMAAMFFFLYIAAANSRTIQSVHLTGIMTPLSYLKLWCGVALIVFYSWCLGHPEDDRGAIARREWLSGRFRLAAIVLCLWIAGAYGAWSHVRRVRPTIPPFAGSRDGAYMRINPTDTSAGLIYVAMKPDGYRLQGTASHLTDHDLDRLSFATTRSAQVLWIETASEGGSRLVGIASESPGMTGCAIDDAETPALSGDGSLLAFVREDRGHGSLWVLDVSQCNGPSSAVPVRMSPPGFDVRTISGGPGRKFLFSAFYQGKQRVFTAAPGEFPQLVAEMNGPLDSPTLSPDGKLLVVRALRSERWQLMLLDLSTRKWKQLTGDDCHAYTPSWQDDHSLLYATDCMRGMGLTTLALLSVDR